MSACRPLARRVLARSRWAPAATGSVGTVALGDHQPAAAESTADQPPVAINPVTPVSYPPALLEQGIEGRVLLRLFVDGRASWCPTRPGWRSRAAIRRSIPPRSRGAGSCASRRRSGTAAPVAAPFLQPVHFRHPRSRSDAMTPSRTSRPYDSVLEHHRLDAADPPGPDRRGHPHADLRQGGVRQPRRLGEGPHRPGDHRGAPSSGASSSPAAPSWRAPAATPASASRSPRRSRATAASSPCPTRCRRKRCGCSRRTAPRW